MIDIRPDPAHPQGGHAILVLPSDAVQGDSVPVSVRDNYGGRFLGENGFQATQVAFGPYAVRRTEGRAEIVIGPEIVNQIEEYTPVRLMVGDTSADLSWPDTVVPAPGAPAMGGIYRPAAGDDPALTGTRAAPEPPSPSPSPSPPEPKPEPAPTPDQASTEPGKPDAKSPLPMILAGLALLLVAAGAGYFLLMPQEPAPEPVAVAAPPEPAPAPADPCAGDALDAAYSNGFATLADRLRDCAGTVSADDALLYVERGADAGDAEALTLFGQLYDGEATDAALETQMGLTFGDAPDRAASYYFRAVEAGSDRAADLLAATCARLAELSDTLSQGAFADYCEPG